MSKLDKYRYDDDERAYVLSVRDTSDETLAWSETTVYYSAVDGETYAVRCDQEGGEEVVWTEKGFVI